MAESAHPTTETTEAEHGGGGLPQFEFQHWGGQIAYLVLLFVILYVLMSRVFAPRMRRVIDERESTIATAIDTAKQVQTEALEQAKAAEAEVAEARARAHRVAADARAAAAAAAAERNATEESRVAARVAEAEARIQAARDAAMSHVGGIANETATAIVAKLTGTAPTVAELKAAEGAR
jgi:F-type H+-transporting ATPase subunit b